MLRFTGSGIGVAVLRRGGSGARGLVPKRDSSKFWPSCRRQGATRNGGVDRNANALDRSPRLLRRNGTKLCQLLNSVRTEFVATRRSRNSTGRKCTPDHMGRARGSATHYSIRSYCQPGSRIRSNPKLPGPLQQWPDSRRRYVRLSRRRYPAWGRHRTLGTVFAKLQHGYAMTDFVRPNPSARSRTGHAGGLSV